jgi:hypothetical protein
VSRYCVFLSRTLRALVFISAVAWLPVQAAIAAQEVEPTGSTTALHWQSPARIHHGVKSTRGNLIFTANGIEFRSEPRFSHRWSFTEIKTLELRPQRLVVTDYENRGHHLSGTRHFDFDLQTPVPPAVAAELTNRVGKPVVNEDPEAKADALFTIPARHSTRFGGTNGILRFRDRGIDYVTTGGKGSRSWRWDEIQTIANPDRYHFHLGGYLETFEFELKQPMTTDLFDRVWDHVYARDLNAARAGGEHHADQ